MNLPRRSEARVVLRFMVIGMLLLASCSKNLYRERPSREPEKPALADDEPDSRTGTPGRTRDGRASGTRKDAPSDADTPAPGSENEIPERGAGMPLEININKSFLEGGTGLSLDVGSTGAGAVIETALEYMGVPHCMGGTTRECLDCSGLLLTAFARNGIRLPHSAEEQARYGRIISLAGQLRRGDLVFFTRSYRTSRYITHSGIYLGNNEFIHVSSTNGVTVTSLSNRWWREKFVFGTRLFERE